ncbi:MAG: hypothetical protein LBF78_07075 [Treponema sp.]|jgi:hypothetical protein|nr:hypothetical protein [Treponema sp.]
MSTIKELEKAQQGYLAAKLAVEKTKPAIVKKEITYEIEDSTSGDGKRIIINPCEVSYDPGKGYITITEKNNHGYDHDVNFRTIVIPLLINALRELAE